MKLNDYFFGICRFKTEFNRIAHVSGLMRAPKIAQFKIKPAKIKLAFFQSKFSSNQLANGANANVPKPIVNEKEMCVYIQLIVWR